MNEYVQINDIFDITTPTVMEQRIQWAFETDGVNFWERFFSFGKTHQDDKIIHLFTEYQLEVLWEWWNKHNNNNIRLNLDYSRQKLLNSLPEGDGKFKEILACYVIYDPDSLTIQRLHFGAQPKRYLTRRNRLKNIDFFAGRFRGNKLDSALTEKERKEELLRLVSMRKEIEKEFGIILKKNEKWMRYLGPKNIDIDCIEYCDNLNKMHVDKLLKLR